MSKKTNLTIEVYTDEGLMHESIGGPMDFEDVRATMISVLKNDGIPVVRVHRKHTPVAEDVGKHAAKEIMDFKRNNQQLQTMPMVLEYEFDGVKFRACGHPLDVHAANNALLKRIFEEES